MNGNPRLTKKTIFLLMGGVLVAAFLGVSAGSYFIQWNSGRKRDAQVKDRILLKVGQTFPRGNFVDVEGKSYLERDLGGKKTILIFFTTECHHCETALQKWADFYPNRNSEYEVVAISYEPVDKLRSYKTEKNLSFPVFNDSVGKFTGTYKIEAYPTIIGINEHREIAFIEIGNNLQKSVEDYVRGL